MQNIHQIEPTVPNHRAASFFNTEQEQVPPMAEFKIELVHAKGRCSRNTDPKAGMFQGGCEPSWREGVSCKPN